MTDFPTAKTAPIRELGDLEHRYFLTVAEAEHVWARQLAGESEAEAVAAVKAARRVKVDGVWIEPTEATHPLMQAEAKLRREMAAKLAAEGYAARGGAHAAEVATADEPAQND